MPSSKNPVVEAIVEEVSPGASVAVPARYRDHPLVARPSEPIDPVGSWQDSALSRFFSDTPTTTDFFAEDVPPAPPAAPPKPARAPHGSALARKKDAPAWEIALARDFPDNPSPEDYARIFSLAPYPATPFQERNERAMIDGRASAEEVHAYMRYKTLSDAEILHQNRVARAMLDLSPEDSEVIDDFLIVVHRNNLGYALAQPKSDGRMNTVYALG